MSDKERVFKYKPLQTILGNNSTEFVKPSWM